MTTLIRATAAICAVTALVAGSAGCEPAELTRPDAAGGDTRTVAFSEIAALLRASCTGSGCHGASDPQGNFGIPDGSDATDMQVASAVRDAETEGDRQPLIVPGAPTESALYLHLTGDRQPSMPLSEKLPEEDIADVRRWIEQGAPYP